VSEIHHDKIQELKVRAEYFEDLVFTLKSRFDVLDRERDSLKQQLAKAKCECDEWRSRCESLESTWLSAQVEAAAMRQVLEVTLKACRAAREALYGVIGLVDESRGVIGWHLSGNEAPWSEFNYPTELVEVVEQLNKCLPEAITREALLITPDSVTEQTEERLPTVEETAGILRGVKTAYEQRKEDEIYARIGRAVEEWLEEVQGWLAHAVYGNAQPHSLIVELADIIAKAREGAKDA